MTINSQSIFISSLNSETKISGFQIKEKKFMFESIKRYCQNTIFMATEIYRY